MNKEKILVAMSGGIDSGTTALLLKQKGFDVIGCTLQMHEYSQKNIDDAQVLCNKIGIDLLVKDVTADFKNIVKEYFYQEYLNGRTPNPCVLCNKKLKWKTLIDTADSLNIEKIATGHYAKIKYTPEKNRYSILKSVDVKKDQTYMLWQLPQEYIKRTIFPIGKFENKNIVRQFARKNNIPFFDKNDSQDICFINDNDYRKFIKEYSVSNNKTENITQGDIVLGGKVIGKHHGYPYYTVGQRRGLGIAYKQPLYVKSIDAQKNIIEVAILKNTFSNGLIANDVNLIKYDIFPTSKDFLVKIRYKDSGTIAKCNIINNKLIVNFYEPRSSVATGQSVVLYEGNELVGGGIIENLI